MEPLESRIAPALLVSISDGAANTTPGSTLTYTIDYSNTGEDAASGVVLTDTLPTGMTFIAAENPDWSQTGSALRFTVGELGAGVAGQKTLILHVANTVPAGLDSLVNTVGITRGSATTPEATDDDTNTLDAAPDLTLTKTNGVEQAKRGDTLTYTLNYTNAGNQNATGVVITETLPEGMTFTAAQNTGWALNGNTLTFTVGNVAAGGNGTATLKLGVQENAPVALTQIVNTAIIGDDGDNGTDLTPSNNTATDTDVLLAPVDLTLTKSDGQATVAPGGTLTYTFNYANTGAIDATGVVITDALPAGTTFNTQGNTGWTLTNGTLTFNVGDVDAGATGTATLVLTVATPAPAGLSAIQSTATIDDDGDNGIDANLANNTAQDTTTLDATPDLTLSKTANVADVAPGDTVTFTFGYTNAGNQNAAGVTLTETLPLGMTFDAAANPGWVLNGATLTYTIGNLASGANGSATLVLSVASAAPAGLEQITSTTTIADNGAGGEDPTPANNFDSVILPLDATPDLTLVKTDGRETALRDRDLTYTFNYTNTGNQNASGVVITDTLPVGTTFDAQANPGWVFDSQSGLLTFTVGNVAASANGSITLVLHVNAELPDGLTTITNVANIANDGTGGVDPTPAGNTSTDVNTIVSTVDLILDKTSPSTSLTPGGSVTYTFTFENGGDTDASGVILTDVLPAGATFDAAANPGWVLNGSTLTFTIGGLAAGADGTATLTLNIVGTVPAGLEQIVNTASIADDGTHGADFDLTDNTATLPLTLDAAPDLTLTVSGGDTAVAPGGTLTYEFTYSNTGTQQAGGVVITETLPAGAVFDAALNPGWSLNGNTLTFTIGSLDAGDGGTATLILKAATSAPAGQTQIVNIATIGDNNTSGADPTPTNNTATATAPLTAGADLKLTITGADTVVPGTGLAFTLNYSNTGNQTAAGVVLTETLPAGTTFNSATSTAGWTEVSPGVYQFTVGSLEGGASGSVVFGVTVNNASAGRESIVESASIAGDFTDPTPADNSAQKTVTLNAAPNLGVTVTSTSTRITTGGEIIYTITYSNTGNQDASGVRLVENLPSGMSFVSAGSTGGWTSLGSGAFQITIGTVPAGESGTATFVAKASSTLTAPTRTNRVSIADDGTNGADTNPANNSASLALPVRAAADPVPSPGAGTGGSGVLALADGAAVEVYSTATGALLYKFHPYGEGPEGVEKVDVQMADFNADGIADIITSSKESSKVRVYDGKTGILLSYFRPFGDAVKGIKIGVWDANGDGVADIIAKQRDITPSLLVFSGSRIAAGVAQEPIMQLAMVD